MTRSSGKAFEELRIKPAPPGVEFRGDQVLRHILYVRAVTSRTTA